jgi:hypothetical protein
MPHGFLGPRPAFFTQILAHDAMGGSKEMFQEIFMAFAR